MASFAEIVFVMVPVACLSSGVSFGDDTDRNRPNLTFSSKRADDRIELTSESDRTVVSIRSPSGISHLSIRRSLDIWPQPIVLRLHLQGLENLRITHGQLTLEAAVSSHDNQLPIRLWIDKHEESPLDATSPYWMAIKRIGKDGKPSKEIPLNDGYFEMQLPAALFENHPKSIDAHWIDFYRG
jgi:hypothetical protein